MIDACELDRGSDHFIGRYLVVGVRCAVRTLRIDRNMRIYFANLIALLGVLTAASMEAAPPKAPEGFEVTIFAEPPQISYPAGIAASPSGVVYVAVDKNSSLDRKPDRGSIVRCEDTDNDGKADRFTAFVPKIESPRGMCYVGNTLYVIHPPLLTAFRDEDNDGVADKSDVLVRGLGYDLSFRGADHTTNGVRMGIDGWLYVAVGDYGCLSAVAKDGSKLTLHGGGVVRIRPDGSELELFTRGQRNIYDVAIDPFMNAFTRDNTNDGGGWDIRLSQVISSANYGYPSLYKNFNDEIMHPLADYGGGSGTGALYLHEPLWPRKFGSALLTCDWGRNIVYLHPLTARGPSFVAAQETFLQIERPTDLDVDGQSRLYVGSWRGGQYKYGGEKVGYVARVTHPGAKAAAFPNLSKADDAKLLEHLASPSHVMRINAQREIIRRGPKPLFAPGLEKLATEDGALDVRVAAIFTLKQLLGAKSTAALIRIAKHDAVREFALRALADRKSQLGDVPTEVFVAALRDKNDRVRLQALIGLGRLGRQEPAGEILPLAALPAKKPEQAADGVIQHVAVQSLVSLRAIDACLQAIESPALRSGALRALQYMHDHRTVDGLIRRLDTTPDAAGRRAVLRTLVRLYHREAEWTKGWWGTRPDTTGPYYKRVTWGQSPRIERVIRREAAIGNAETITILRRELPHHKINLPKLKFGGPGAATDVAILIEQPNPPASAIGVLAAAVRDKKRAPAFRARALAALRRATAERVPKEIVEVLAALAAEKSPHDDLLAERQYFLFDSVQARHVDYFIRLAGEQDAARRVLAYGVLVNLAWGPLSDEKTQRAANKAVAFGWKDDRSVVSVLRAVGETGATSYERQVRILLKDKRPAVRAAAASTTKALGLSEKPTARGPLLGKMSYDKLQAAVLAEKGNVIQGRALFIRQRCVVCHAVSPGATPVGPFLGGIAKRYKPHEIVKSIVDPDATIAQGFATQLFATKDGRVLSGFVVREAADEVEIRDAHGVRSVLAKDAIEERSKAKMSVMPKGLVDKLTPKELASILAYLTSLGGK
jgi:putative membrane-bound dehydrogenase-like protein